MAGSHPRVLTLSPKELLVLELLRDQESYGLQLVAASSRRLKRGTVYVTLGRMEQKGYITALGRRMFAAWTSGAKQLVPEFGR
jgi:DNA-binding PadR family transcriptional regulator